MEHRLGSVNSREENLALSLLNALLGVLHKLVNFVLLLVMDPSLGHLKRIFLRTSTACFT